MLLVVGGRRLLWGVLWMSCGVCLLWVRVWWCGVVGVVVVGDAPGVGHTFLPITL